MKYFIYLVLIVLFSCSRNEKSKLDKRINMSYNENEILKEFDLAINQIPSMYFPIGSPEYIKYNFFLDLEHGYCSTAGNRIYLYADSFRWAVVFEKSGYHNRSTSAEIELNYIGNCIDYPVEKYHEKSYITNTKNIVLIDPNEFKRIENKVGDKMETFELIEKNIKNIKIRDNYVQFDNNYKNYEKLGIKIRSYNNTKKLVNFENLVRYLHETNPDLLCATDKEIRKHIPLDIPKIMIINEFHYESNSKNLLPSKQETFQLIAKILKLRDSSLWKPINNPNNSWKNWDSGNL